jgi:hypothetical protein
MGRWRFKRGVGDVLERGTYGLDVLFTTGKRPEREPARRR